jgi:hypothetical protein
MTLKSFEVGTGSAARFLPSGDMPLLIPSRIKWRNFLHLVSTMETGRAVWGSEVGLDDARWAGGLSSENV